MKKFLFLVCAIVVLSASDKTPQQKYVEKYSGIAVSEMIRSGVPASITLAQGMLESGCGMSRLAVEGNNHFGIKCHSDWKGKTMREDDDAPKECFRVYASAEGSFRDHSDFLRYSDRYKPLFSLERTDYRGWAEGLKKAGYATDPKYPSKLIKLIEENSLARFDVSEQSVQEVKSFPVESYDFSIGYRLRSPNGVPYVLCVGGETYESIAEAENLFLEELLRFNDLAQPEDLSPGTIVYLQRKKARAARGQDKYIVSSDGESLHAICQRFAVREKSVMKRNGLKSDSVLREGDTIRLR